MKVILLDNVKNVGKKFELTEVKAGYARNFLFARGLAEAVTKSSAKRVAELQHKKDAEGKRVAEKLENAFKGIKGLMLNFTRKANEEGHLYAGVTKDEIAEDLAALIKAEITGGHIMLEKPIKEIGEHTVTAKLADKEMTFSVIITAEKE